MTLIEVRFRLLPASMAGLVMMICGACVDASSYRISCQPVASAFLLDESVEFTISTDLPLRDVDWSVTDFSGRVRVWGVIRVGAGHPATLRVRPRPGVGYYTLRLMPRSGAAIERVFCVLPPPDEARGDGGLFGIGGHFHSVEEWEMAARMGARHVRAEFAWPEVEREEGQFDLEWVDRFAQAARERNIQLTVLAGHTPRHYGVRPADAEGRVASAWYTWQPEGTVEWYRFVDTLARRLVPRRLAPEPAHPADTLPRSPQPLVRAWEVWSEADQNFYYGSWDRYLDMLRIAWCTVRSYGRVPIVYGSCGHMTEMVYTFRAGCGSYLDRVAYHPWGNDPDYELMHWFRNMPQQMIARGVPPETAFTECDFYAGSVEEQPGFILRLYATLKSWRQRDFVRSGCTGGVFTRADRPHSMARQVDGRWVPRPAMVAFALARWLLDGAHYIGPLDAPEGVRLELFMRQGSPIVIAWTERNSRQVTLPVSPTAVLMDAVGSWEPLSGYEATLEVTPDAVAVLGASMTLIAPAATAAIERVLTTELGHESPYNSRHIDTLERDAVTCGAADFGGRIRTEVARACERFERRPAHGASAFFEAQHAVGEAMLEITMEARRRGELRPLDMNTIWRLGQLVEQMGVIADGVGERWRRMNNVTPDDLAKTQGQIEAIRARVRAASGGGECPFADRLLERALEQLEIVRTGGGQPRGAWWTATHLTRVAHALTGVERPELRRAFVAGEFTTSTAITRGMLLDPGVEHVVHARVFNFLHRELSGVVRTTVPEDWSNCIDTVLFQLGPNEHTEPLAIPFTVPDEPRPWVQRTLSRPEWQDTEVDAPATVSLLDRLNITLVAVDAPAAIMSYRLLLGAYPSKGAVSEDDPLVYRLPVLPPGDGSVIAPGPVTRAVSLR